MEHVVFEFTESYRPWDSTLDDETYDALSWSQCHRVSTRKLEAFKEANLGAYEYVQHLVEGALRGSYALSSSRKYSFSDVSDWYKDLEPDDDCTDPVVYVDVELS